MGKRNASQTNHEDNTMNIQQNHKNGERVFCFSQSMLGGASKIWGTVKQCKKHKWVILDDGTNQSRVRYDRAFWYTELQWSEECEYINKKHEEEKRHEEQKAKTVRKQYKKALSNQSSAVVSVGKAIKVISKYDPSMTFTYSVTEIKNGTIFGLDDSGREVCVGSVNDAYFAA